MKHDSILSKVSKVDLQKGQFFEQEFTKTQIYLHGTASGKGVDGDFQWWNVSPERVATCIIVGNNGIAYQCFSSKFWAYHLGTNYANNLALHQHSIGLEIDNWGWLTKKGNKYYSYAGTEIPVEEVQVYDKPFRGYLYYHKYSAAQIETVKGLLLYWGERYNIPLDYNEEMFDISARAARGEPGVWGHTSVRRDKTDCHPQKELIDMLKTLKGLL